MLEITIPARELFNEKTEEFFTTKEQKLKLEHSLVSLSKWESKWHKSFLNTPEKTLEEITDYIRCMNLTQNVDTRIFSCLTNENIEEITNYIENPMTATFFSDTNQGHGSSEIITSEVIYYWMIALNIPFECQKWHLNRLLTLVRVCNAKNQPKKKMSSGEIMRRNAELNAARRAKLNSKG